MRGAFRVLRIGLPVAGYGSNHKRPFFGGLRAAAQTISYEFIQLFACYVFLYGHHRLLLSHGFTMFNKWNTVQLNLLPSLGVTHISLLNQLPSCHPRPGMHWWGERVTATSSKAPKTSQTSSPPPPLRSIPASSSPASPPFPPPGG